MKVGLHIAIWTIAIAIAGAFDAPVARTMRESGVEHFLHAHARLRDTLKFPGYFGFTLLAVIIPVSLLHRARWRAGLFVLLATATSTSNLLFKWMAGRSRPFKPPDGSGRLVPFELHPFPADGTNLCFPSGHACLAFATAAALAMLCSHNGGCPRSKWRWTFYLVATLVAVERFAENAHWLSDTVAAAALGIGGAHLVGWLFSSSWKINLNDPTSRS